MNILAFVIALFSAVVSFLQGGCGTVLSGLGHGLSSEYGSRGDTELFAALGGASLLIVLGSFVGLTGGILAIQRKRSAFTVLLVSAGMCGLAFVMSGGNFAAGGVWGVLYLASAICAKVGYNNANNSLTESKLQYTDNQNTRAAVTLTKREVPNIEPRKSYEPVIGLETDALIKRAFLFLEDGEMYNAERYIEQALNQDLENPQVYMAKLMLEYRVKSPVELLNKLSTPLENEKLYQRALRFADGEYKSQLEGLAQASRNMLEQERMRAEKEEAEERARQKVLMLENKEKYYQEAVLNWQKAKTPDEIQAVITRLEKLKGYKGADELLSEARERLVEEKRRLTKGISLSVALIALIWGGIAFVGSYNDAKRIEEARLEEQARLQTSPVFQSVHQKEFEALRHYIEYEAPESLRQEMQEHNREYELLHSLRVKPNLTKEEQEQYNALLKKLYPSLVKPSIQDVYAQGESYLNAKNYALALEIFRRLANDGYAPAQDKLAWMYQNGWGVPQNYDTAMEWYGKAASQGSEVAQRRINSIQLLQVNKQKISSIERGTGFPISGTIFAETLSVRQSPDTSSKRIKTLKTGHPVSISRAVDSDNDYWFYVKTASGTEGWVLGGYVNLIDRDLSYQETNNKKRTLPASGYVTTREDSLNLRNIPTVKGSSVVEKLDSGTYFTAYEVFAGDTIDWYRIRTIEGDEGWVSGKYIELNY